MNTELDNEIKVQVIEELYAHLYDKLYECDINPDQIMLEIRRYIDRLKEK